MILRDSQLKEFKSDQFSFLFKATTLNMSSIGNALENDNIKDLTSNYQADCFVIELGINDLRTKSTKDTIRDMKTLIDRLLSKSLKPVVICKLVPSLNEDLNNKVSTFNKELEVLMESYDSQVTLNRNRSFWRMNKDELKEVYVHDDESGVHINKRGVALLSDSIKYTVASALNITIIKKRRSV